MNSYIFYFSIGNIYELEIKTLFFIIKVQLITSQKRQEESTTVKPNTESSMRQTLLSDQLTHGGERKPPT
jgi:hypothetical protein